MIWIIEPHSDDAFLSLHTHLSEMWATLPRTIVTLYADRLREREAAAYAAAVGCEHRCLRLIEGGGLGKPPGEIPPFREWGLTIRPADIIIFPVGIQHPEHVAVRRAVPVPRLDRRPFAAIRFYLDTPYYTKQKCREETNLALKGLVIDSVCYASKTKWKHIPLFKTQGRYFFHHPPESLPLMELVLRKRVY